MISKFEDTFQNNVTLRERLQAFRLILSLKQWFSNLRVNQNHMESSLKLRIPGPSLGFIRSRARTENLHVQQVPR